MVIGVQDHGTELFSSKNIVIITTFDTKAKTIASTSSIIASYLTLAYD